MNTISFVIFFFSVLLDFNFFLAKIKINLCLSHKHSCVCVGVPYDYYSVGDVLFEDGL